MHDAETRSLVVDSAARLFADLADVPLDRAWSQVSEQGLPLILVPEDLGGLALDGATAAAVIADAAGRALALPIGETIVANLLLARAGIAPDDRVTTLADAAGERTPWAPQAARIVAAAPDDPATMLVIERAAATDAGTTLAGTPVGAVVPPADAPRASLPGGADAIRRCGAALRTIQLAGAARAVLALTVEHVSTRQQFGRTLSKFQAIQQELARMAGQVAALDGAAGIAAEFLDGPLEPSLALAAAKARASEAAGIVAAIAHQAHGAIGFTAEYHLGDLTKSLWAWRAEFGGSAYWHDRIADAVFARPADDLWPTIVAA